MDKKQTFWWINGEYDEHYTRERPSICYLHVILRILTSKLAFSPEHCCVDVTCQMNVS